MLPSLPAANSDSGLRPWLMWSLPVVFIAYQFVLRLWPGLAMQHIMQQHNVDATSFGWLSALYYVGYAGMQIPVAILLDRYNPRYLIAGFTILTGVSALLFTHATSWPLALIGRFLIGFASAVGILGASKTILIWFPENRYTRMMSLTVSFGLLGAVYGGRPVNALIEIFGFFQTSQYIAFVGIALGLIILAFYRCPIQPHQVVGATDFNLKDFKTLLSHRSLLLLGISNLLMVGALEGFGDSWGVNFLAQVYHQKKEIAAGIITFIYLGMLCGGPLLALLSDKIGKHNTLIISGLGLAGLFALILMNPQGMIQSHLQEIFFIVGILCCYQVIVFSTSTDYVNAKLVGVTVALMNSINMFGGTFFHLIIGYTADLMWQGEKIENIRIYSNQAYSYALMAIPVCALLGAFLIPLMEKPSKLASST